MEQKYKAMYSEVYAVLTKLGPGFEIPPRLFEFIRDNRDMDYAPEINNELALDKQNLMSDTIAMFALLKALYWCKDENEKRRLKMVLDGWID